MKRIFIKNQLLTSSRLELFYFPIDTLHTLKDRIAEKIGTLPEFLFFTKELIFPPPEETEFEVFDLWIITRDFTRRSRDIVELISKVPQYNPELVFTLWLNLDLISLEEANLKGLYYNLPEFNSSIMNRNLTQEWETLKKNVNKTFYFLLYITDNEIPFNLSKFQVKKKQYLYKFTFVGNLSRIFDLLHCENNVYYIVYQNFFKIKPSFTPSLNWNAPENSLLIKYFSDKEYKSIIVSNDEKIHEFTIQTEEELFEMIPKIFYFTKSFQITQNKVSGNFYIKYLFNTFIVDDILCSENLFRYFVMSDNLNRMEQTTGRAIHFQHPFQDYSVVFSFSNAHNISKIHIYSIDIKYFDDFIYYIKKIIFEYLKRKEEIILFYKDEGFVLKDIIRKEISLLDQKLSNKQLFNTEWIRSCQFPRHIFRAVEYDGGEILSTIIENNQAYSTILFPKEPFTFSDGTIEEPTYYYCIFDTIPYYVGLKESKTELGYDVCCYKTNQKDLKTSAYYRYYFPDEYIAPLSFLYIIEKGKKLSNNQQGLIKVFSKLVLLKEQILNNNEYLFRVGVEDTPDSILNCLNKFFNKKIKRSDLTTFLQAKEGNSLFLKQEMWDVDILSYFSSNEFLSPLKVKRLLEQVYKANIIIFDGSKEGELVLPDFKDFYCSNNSIFDKTCCILINYGAEFDHKKYPNCELIVYSTDILIKNNKITSFKYNNSYPEKFSTFCVNVYQRLLLQYVMNPVPSLSQYFALVKQYISPNGKVRGLLIRYRNSNIIINTGPLQPYSIPKMSRDDLYHENDNEIVKLFVVEFGRSITKFESNTFTYYSFLCFDVLFTIYIKIPKNYLFNTFLRNEQLSRYKIDLTRFIFSSFCENKSLTNEKQLVSTFLNNYSMITDVNQLNLDFNFKDDYLYFTDEEVKKIKYQLFLILKRRSFTKNTYSENYYKYSNDFNGRVYYNNSYLVNFFKNEKDISNVYSNPCLTNRNTLFFYHPIATNFKIIFTKKCDTLREAVSVFVYWNKKHVLPLIEIPIGNVCSLLIFNIVDYKWYHLGEIVYNTPIIIKYADIYLPVLSLIS